MVEKRPRLYHVDLLRGYLLFAIAIDHLQRWPSLIEIFTGGGRQWASAAEGFFFLSGMMLGYVRGPQMEKIGVAKTLKKILSRAALLYIISVSLSILFVWWAVKLGGHTGITPAPSPLVFNITTIWKSLTYQIMYGWTNFLGFYVVFLLASPIILLLLKRGWWYMAVAAIGTVWLFSDENFYLAWQLLFLGGTIIGYYYPTITNYLRSLPSKIKTIGIAMLIALSVLTYPISLFYNSNPDELVHQYLSKVVIIPLDKFLPKDDIQSTIARSVQSYNVKEYKNFDRDSLPWERLVFFSLWFSTLLLLFKRFENPLRRSVGWLLLKFGQNSLLTFTIEGIVVFWVNYTWPQPSNTILINIMSNLSIILFVYVLVQVSLWVHQKMKKPRSLPVTKPVSPLATKPLLLD